MFVVNRSNTHPAASGAKPQNTRSASQRQRGRTAFSLPQSATGTTRRSSDVGTSRGDSPQSANNLLPAAKSSPPSVQQAPGVGVQKLLDTLSALGMSTAGVNINYTEDVVGYPGGSYVNRQINITGPNGNRESFSGDLTDKNPLITAYEMQRYFGIRPNT